MIKYLFQIHHNKGMFNHVLRPLNVVVFVLRFSEIKIF